MQNSLHTNKMWVYPEEYFLLEVRNPEADYYERGAPRSGVLTWHVDEQGVQHDEHRKRVDVECEDGRRRDAGCLLEEEPDPLVGGEELDFWPHGEGYRLAHAGNWGDATDLVKQDVLGG